MGGHDDHHEHHPARASPSGPAKLNVIEPQDALGEEDENHPDGGTGHRLPAPESRSLSHETEACTQHEA
jgi:hypothetical protein